MIRLSMPRADYALADVYRRIHGYGISASSWTMRRKGAEWPRRFDLVLAARLGAASCDYVQEWRAAGLSDHAAVAVGFR